MCAGHCLGAKSTATKRWACSSHSRETVKTGKRRHTGTWMTRHHILLSATQEKVTQQQMHWWVRDTSLRTVTLNLTAKSKQISEGGRSRTCERNMLWRGPWHRKSQTNVRSGSSQWKEAWVGGSPRKRLERTLGVRSGTVGVLNPWPHTVILQCPGGTSCTGKCFKDPWMVLIGNLIGGRELMNLRKEALV